MPFSAELEVREYTPKAKSEQSEQEWINPQITQITQKEKAKHVTIVTRASSFL